MGRPKQNDSVGRGGKAKGAVDAGYTPKKKKPHLKNKKIPLKLLRGSASRRRVSGTSYMEVNLGGTGTAFERHQ